MYFLLEKMFTQNTNNDVLNDSNLLDNENAVYEDVVCRLENIPLKIVNEQYILRGAGVFIGRKITARSVGHYVAIALRNDGQWEKYDDFQKKITTVPKQIECAIQLLLYTKL